MDSGVGSSKSADENRAHLTTLASIVDAFPKFRWGLWILIAAALFLVSNHPLARGRAVGIWDVDGQYYPWQVLVADYARAGRFVHWDPWSNAGLPALGDPQIGVFSPLNFSIGLITGGTSSGFLIYWLLMWWLGGFGMFMLARHLRAPAWGGCAVALGVLFCGVYTGNAQHTSIILAFSFLPLIIWRFDAALCSRRIQPAVEAGALWGLSALAGYPGLTIMTGCFSALWALGRWRFAESPGIEGASISLSSTIKVTRRPSLWFVLVALALVLVVGLMVLSPTYVAFFFEGAGTHTRVGTLSRDIAVLGNALHPGALSTFASPYLTILKAYDQLQGGNRIWPYTDLSMASIYAGAIIAALGLFALFRRPRDGWRWWLACLAALSLACALGQLLPLRGWLYDWLYPMRFFRHAALFRAYYIFSIAALALLATRDLAIALRSPVEGTWTRFVVAAGGTACCALLVFLTFTDSPARLASRLSIVHVFGVWLGICGVALIGRVLPDGQRRRYIPVLFVALAGGDAFLTATISKMTIFATGAKSVERWKILDREHSSVLELTKNGLLREESPCDSKSSSKNFDPNSIWPSCYRSDQLITKVPVFNSYATTTNVFHLRMANHHILREIAIGRDRTWFSPNVVQVAATESSFAAFARRTEELDAPPLLIHRPEVLLGRTDKNKLIEANADQITAIATLSAAEKIPVDLIKYLPDELVFRVQCPTDGWLLITDRWARSWRAEVNGEQITLYGGNFIFRAIRVSAGANEVRFTYHPFGFPWLVSLSWGTLGAVAFGAIVGSRTIAG